MNRSLAALGLALTIVAAPSAQAADEYSVAEQRVFLDNQMMNVRGTTTIEYHFVQTGGPSDNFEDSVKLNVGDGPLEQRTLAVEYLSGKRKMDLPSIEGGTGNPVVLYFLEHDIRDLHDRLGGQQAYFRKRIRLALADAAKVKPVTFSFQGKQVEGIEVTIEPYANDALKDRFGRFAGKTYVFTLSDAVPGNVFEIRTSTAATTGSAAAPAITTALKIRNAGR